MSKLLFAICTFVVIANLAQLSHGCSCEAPDFRRQFCRSKYAAVITVDRPTTRNDDGLYAAYKFTTRTVLAANDEDSERVLLGSQIIHVRRRKTSCAADLQPGTTYVIYGQPSSDGRIVATACNAIAYDFLTDEERAEIERYSQKGLPCRR